MDTGPIIHIGELMRQFHMGKQLARIESRHALMKLLFVGSMAAMGMEDLWVAAVLAVGQVDAVGVVAVDAEVVDVVKTTSTWTTLDDCHV
jgi:hypothetical protein